MSDESIRVATSIPPLPTGSEPSRWLRALESDFRDTLAKRHLGADLGAAASVACVALPLSMAIALASDVDPRRGLITAIVGGVVASIAASSRLSVSGPAAAMAVLVGQIVDAHGLAGLAFVTVVAGLLQIISGAVGLGVLTRVVPTSVIHGFTAGIGVVILVGQLPRALGLPAPDESHAFSVLTHVGSLLNQSDPFALGLALLVAVPMMLGPKRAPRVPFALIGVVLATAIATAFGSTTPRVGTMPSLGFDGFPALPHMKQIPTLIADAFAVFALASLETLLSVSSLDQLRSGERHDPNHELVGQGLGNLASGLVGGIPITAVIARSALNVQSGAHTRRAAFLHAIFLAVAVVLARPLLETIPVAALGGVLIAVGLRMLDLGLLRELWKSHRSEAVIFLVTALVMIASDLLVGVQAGLLAATVLTLVRLTRASVRFAAGKPGEPHHVTLEGALTFLGAPRLHALERKLSEAAPESGCLVDTRNLDSLDETAAERLMEALATYVERGGKVVVLAPQAQVESKLIARARRGIELALTESDADAKLGRRSGDRARRRIADGLARFHREMKPKLSPLLGRLAAGQQPHTMLLTCADSRVVPSLITGAAPGEVFVVRNIGALIPPHGSETLNDEGAALEYAIRVLGIRNIVVCSHSNCGAVTALCTGKIPDELEALRGWLEGSRSIAGTHVHDDSENIVINDEAKLVALRQLENLKTYPLVARGLEEGDIHIEAWFYDVETGDVWGHRAESDRWVSMLDSDE